MTYGPFDVFIQAALPTPDVAIQLPLPPSANRMYRHNAGRVHKAADYRAWVKTIGWQCLAGGACGKVPYRYTIALTFPQQLKDPDNLIKPTQDALQKAGVLANDRHARGLLFLVEAAQPADTMLVRIWALPDAAPKRRRAA